MVKVKPQSEITENYVRGSIEAYLKERKDLNWIIGIIKSENFDKGKLEQIFNEVQSYTSLNPLFFKLQNKCKQLGFL